PHPRPSHDLRQLQRAAVLHVQRRARCVARPPPEPRLPAHLVQVTSEAAGVVDDLARNLRPLELAVEHAWWNAAVRAAAETDHARVAADPASADALADERAFAALQDAQRNNGADTLTRRQLDMLHDAYAPNQVPADVRKAIVELRAAIESTFS